MPGSLAVSPLWEGALTPLRRPSWGSCPPPCPPAWGQGNTPGCDLGKVKAEAREPTTGASAWSIYFSKHSRTNSPGWKRLKPSMALAVQAALGRRQRATYPRKAKSDRVCRQMSSSRAKEPCKTRRKWFIMPREARNHLGEEVGFKSGWRKSWKVERHL